MTKGDPHKTPNPRPTSRSAAFRSILPLPEFNPLGVSFPARRVFTPPEAASPSSGRFRCWDGLGQAAGSTAKTRRSEAVQRRRPAGRKRFDGEDPQVRSDSTAGPPALSGSTAIAPPVQGAYHGRICFAGRTSQGSPRILALCRIRAETAQPCVRSSHSSEPSWACASSAGPFSQASSCR